MAKKRKKKSKEDSDILLLKTFFRFMFLRLPYYLFIVFKYLFMFLRWLFFGSLNLTRKIRLKNRKKRLTALDDDFEIIQVDKGDFKKFENELFKSDSKIGLILGARGSGKTAIGIKILEKAYIRTKKKCFAIGFSKSEMPPWINIVSEISEIANNSFVIIDEGGILYSSRNAMTNANKILSDLILIARHKNLTILFISQNSSNIEVNVIRQSDFIILKPSSLLQKDFERKIIRDLYEKLAPDFEKLSMNKGLTYIYSDKFNGFVTNTLPSFWDEKISKSFSDKSYEKK